MFLKYCGLLFDETPSCERDGKFNKCRMPKFTFDVVSGNHEILMSIFLDSAFADVCKILLTFGGSK